jgi:hypothetical protein
VTGPRRGNLPRHRWAERQTLTTKPPSVQPAAHLTVDAADLELVDAVGAWAAVPGRRGESGDVAGALLRWRLRKSI